MNQRGISSIFIIIGIVLLLIILFITGTYFLNLQKKQSEDANLNQYSKPETLGGQPQPAPAKSPGTK